MRLGPDRALNTKRPESSVSMTATRRGTAPRIHSRSHTSMPASAMAFSPGIVRRPRIGTVPPKGTLGRTTITRRVRRRPPRERRPLTILNWPATRRVLTRSGTFRSATFPDASRSVERSLLALSVARARSEYSPFGNASSSSRDEKPVVVVLDGERGPCRIPATPSFDLRPDERRRRVSGTNVDSRRIRFVQGRERDGRRGAVEVQWRRLRGTAILVPGRISKPDTRHPLAFPWHTDSRERLVSGPGGLDDAAGPVFSVR